MTFAVDDQDADRLNDRMVDELVGKGAIEHPRIERAFRAVRRDWFLPDPPLGEVFADRAVVTHRGPGGVAISSSSQPSLMARMLGQLRLDPGMAVLEIGTGTGYNAALLGHVVGPEGSVVTVDLDPAITGPARQRLAQTGAFNVSVVTGDGWAGGAKGVVFDRIQATVGVWDVSPAWAEQLRHGGVLVSPLWLRAGVQASIAFEKADGRLESVSVEPCGFMRLRGPGAGEPTYRQLGAWTVSLDRADTETTDVLAALLDSEPHRRPAPQLRPGWFTPIALGEPDAVHLYSQGPHGPVVYAGVLRLSPPSLAVVESHPLADPSIAEQVCVFGGDEAQVRLLDLIQHRPPIDIRRVAISAAPSAEHLAHQGAISTLVRPTFTMVIRRAPD